MSSPIRLLVVDDHPVVRDGLSSMFARDPDFEVLGEAAVQHEGLLSVLGQKEGEDDAQYLHRGIAGRSFERKFRLADHVKVSGARLVNGMLTIELKREIPEEKKPRAIRIEATGSPKTITQQ